MSIRVARGLRLVPIKRSPRPSRLVRLIRRRPPPTRTIVRRQEQPPWRAR